MKLPRHLTTLLPLAAALMGCRPWHAARSVATGPAHELPKAQSYRDYLAAHIGPFGYQDHGLGQSRTGSGALMSAGLVARGGGVPSGPVPRGLAPDEHIGSANSDGTERVVIDPATRETAVYSQSPRARARAAARAR